MPGLNIQVDKDGNGYTAKCNDREAWHGDPQSAVFKLLIENPDLGITISVDEDAEYKG